MLARWIIVIPIGIKSSFFLILLGYAIMNIENKAKRSNPEQLSAIYNPCVPSIPNVLVCSYNNDGSINVNPMLDNIKLEMFLMF
jgi:hypothetical protein